MVKRFMRGMRIGFFVRRNAFVLSVVADLKKLGSQLKMLHCNKFFRALELESSPRTVDCA